MVTLLTDAVFQHIPKRGPESHKGNVGRVGIVAGSSMMTGAAVLCARAAFAMGAGQVYVFSVADVARAIQGQVPEVIAISLDTDSDFLRLGHLSQLLAFIGQHQIDAMIIGPGLGRHLSTQYLVQRLLGLLELPLVVDADALFSLSKGLLKALPTEMVLTPHTGEFRHLFDRYPSDREEVVRAVSQEIPQVLVLKGLHSLIAHHGHVTENPTGNPGLANAGTGDVLSGLIGALLAKGIAPLHAAQLGVYLHGKTADFMLENRMTISASTLVDSIPKVIPS